MKLNHEVPVPHDRGHELLGKMKDAIRDHSAEINTSADAAEVLGMNTFPQREISPSQPATRHNWKKPNAAEAEKRWQDEHDQ